MSRSYLLDDAVQVHVDEVLPRRRAPVAEQHVLDVAERERPPQQRVVAEIDLADRQVVRGAPVGVHALEQLRAPAWLRSCVIMLACRSVRRGGAGEPTDLAIIEFLVGADDPNGDPAGVASRSRPRGAALRSSSMAMPRKPSPAQIRAAHRRRRSRRCRRQRRACRAAERGRIGADALLRLVAEQRDRFGGATVACLRAGAGRACRRWSPRRRAGPTRDSPSPRTRWHCALRSAPGKRRGRDRDRRSACPSPSRRWA